MKSRKSAKTLKIAAAASVAAAAVVEATTGYHNIDNAIPAANQAECDAHAAYVWSTRGNFCAEQLWDDCRDLEGYYIPNTPPIKGVLTGGSCQVQIYCLCS